MSGIVYTIEEAVEQTGWSKEKIIKNAQQGNFIIETVRKPTKNYMDGTKRYTSYYDHIIQDEFNKLLELAGKPSITQLEAIIQAQQEEIERLKAENEALKAEPTTTEKEENGKGFYTSLAIIHALYKMAREPQLKAISLTTTDIGRTVEPDAISNRLKNTSFKNK